MAQGCQRTDSGFGFLEVMLGGAILSVAMLAYGSSMMTHRGLAKEQVGRSQAMIAARQFMERLRADDDWAGLYSRCRLRLALASADGGQEPRLADGRAAWDPTVYYPDFADRTDLRTLIEVPLATDKETGLPVLREDVASAKFLLPLDLDADGAIDDENKNATYRFLPVVVHFLWTTEAGETREMRLTTVLRGDS